MNIPINFGFNWPDGFREEDYNVQVYGRRQRVMTVPYLGSGGLKKANQNTVLNKYIVLMTMTESYDNTSPGVRWVKKANENTVSNKYMVLIGWFWITRTTIVLGGFMITRPRLSITPEKRQNITFCVYMLTQISRGGRRGHDCMVAGFTTTCAISDYHY